METRCVLIKLKPNSRDRVREWANTLNARKDEALATLRDEGVIVESAFLYRREDGDFLVYYMKAENLQKAEKVAKESRHAIDSYHKQFKRDTWDRIEELELLVDFDRITEVRGANA